MAAIRRLFVFGKGALVVPVTPRLPDRVVVPQGLHGLDAGLEGVVPRVHRPERLLTDFRVNVSASSAQSSPSRLTADELIIGSTRTTFLVNGVGRK